MGRRISTLVEPRATVPLAGLGDVMAALAAGVAEEALPRVPTSSVAEVADVRLAAVVAAVPLEQVHQVSVAALCNRQSVREPATDFSILKRSKNHGLGAKHLRYNKN